MALFIDVENINVIPNVFEQIVNLLMPTKSSTAEVLSFLYIGSCWYGMLNFVLFVLHRPICSQMEILQPLFCRFYDDANGDERRIYLNLT